ncbi:dynein assembly factor with WDR repeat domains 1 [Pseudomonas sp. IT-194MI4]|uniref:nSTAND1 domain-containing NTPase n=1 Tax=Pseudomonas sp. IT-194MI4 TaxID=3026443 RepID=UPI0039DF3A8D
MSRIFLSHSHVDELEAIALKHWLAENGWDDVFLDVDPRRGLVAGERWQEALKRAADRCEAVVFIISPAWARSKWCLAEFLLAKSLNKRLFGVLFQDVAFDELPIEMTVEWQLCHLTGHGPTHEIVYMHGEQSIKVAFLAEGLLRLKTGLYNAGLQADFFPWPPKDDSERAPYRGLEPLDTIDAAVFFGRDAEILQGLDRLRGMRSSSTESLFIILGASGAGKSSFLRAGLLPRLARDDRHFFPLQPIRPGSGALYGERGLAQVIHEANLRLNLEPGTLGGVKAAVSEGAERFTAMLCNLQDAARARLMGLPDDAPPPTLVLSVDQAEELFSADGNTNMHEAAQAKLFLELIGSSFRSTQTDTQSVGRVPMIVVFTIRSDGYEPLQTAPQLCALKSVVFDALKPMPRAQFKEVITGPAQRATDSGRKLVLRPDLINRLLEDCDQGGDSLPLLGLTLARLYRDYGSDADLRLDEYERMGGMADVIKDEAESVLSSVPDIYLSQLELLHNAFIPALVAINPINDQPLRRVAAMSDLPAESRPLIRALVDKHLLLSDLREGASVVEVAHESLFRQWDVLVDWLREERLNLKEVDRLEQAVLAWLNNGRKTAWLLQGERLDVAEVLALKSRYRRRLEGVSEFLLASRAREMEQREQEASLREKRINAEAALRQEAEKRQLAAEKLVEVEARERATAQLAANGLKRQARKLIVAVVVVVIALVVSIVGIWHAKTEQAIAEFALSQANGLRMASQAMAMLDSTRPGGDERALLQLVAAGRAVSHVEVEGAMLAAMVGKSDVKKLWNSDGAITAVAFSPDNSRIVSGSTDHTLRLWDAHSGQAIGASLKGHEGAVTSVAFSPDGSRIVSGSSDKTLRMWDAHSGQQIGEPLRGHEDEVLSVDFSHDGNRIVSGSMDQTLRLWDAHSGQPIGAPLRGHEDLVMSVAFSPDGSRIVSGSGDNTLRLWDAHSGKPIGRPLKGHIRGVVSVAFSPDGHYIVSGSDDKTLRIWDALSGKSLGDPFVGHERVVTSVAFSPDGSRVLSSSDDHVLLMWDTHTGEPIGSLLHGSPRVSWNGTMKAAFSPDGTSIVSVADHSLMLWNTNIGQMIGVPLEGHKRPIASVSFSPDGTRIVSGSMDKTLRLWDVRTGQPIGAALSGHEDMVLSVGFSPDGTRIVSGSMDKTLRLWDSQSGQPIGGAMLGHESGVQSVVFSPDGNRLVSGSWDGTLRLWDAHSGKAIGAPLLGHKEGVMSVAFSPDGKRIVSGGSDSSLRLWDSTSGQPIGTPMLGHSEGVWSVAFSPDGKRVVSGSADHTLRLWDADSGQAIGAPLLGHENGVVSVAFSPDGKLIVSGSDDSTLRFWESQSGQPIGVPLLGAESSLGGLLSVAFSPDGNWIASGSRDTVLRLWPAPKIWPDALCTKLTRNMSRREWSDWVSPEVSYSCQCPGLPIPADSPASDTKPEVCPGDHS